MVHGGIDHDLECLPELRRIAELLDQLEWWRWAARWLVLLLCLVLLLAAGVILSVTGVASECARCFLRRRRSEAERGAEVAALRQRALARRPLALQ